MPWWTGDPRENYWLEITGRDDVGAELWHYLRTPEGRTIPSTPLLREMRRDDVVLHYYTPEHAVVGRSRVADDAAVDGLDGDRPYVSRQVTGFAPTVPPITLADLRRPDAAGAILDLQDSIEARHGRPTWTPFVLHAERLRPRTQYLAKLPAAMVPIIEGAASRDGTEPPEQGRLFDPSRTPTEGTFGQPANPREKQALQEKAKQAHHLLLVALYRTLKRSGWREIRETKAIDLMAVDPGGDRVIFEAKTLSGSNELQQTRAGFAQLHEYRCLYGDGTDEICLVVDQRLSAERTALLEALNVPVLALQADKFVAATPRAGTLTARLALQSR